MVGPDSPVHFQRMGGYDVDELPDARQMARLGTSDIPHDLRMIAKVRPDVVLYGCTSATLTHGPGFDATLARDIEAAAGARTFTAAGSLVAAIKTLGAKQVGFSSPYVGETNEQAVAFIASHGITTAARANIGRDLGNYGQGELTPDEVFDLALKAYHPKVDAIVLSCTDLRAVEAVARIEALKGKPVVTSIHAMMFALMRTLAQPRHAGLPGQPFDLL